MYLEHFNLKTVPFSLTPNTEFYCNLPGHQAALNVLLLSLRSGEGFIKITGEVGSGKTLLCRLLLERLGEQYVTAYIPNPDLSPAGLRRALAMELHVPKPHPADPHNLLALITEHLIKYHEAGKHVVMLIDEAQALSIESLEALRLLTNLETKTTKLMQMVLFGQSELDAKLNKAALRQLKQRISFSYHLPTLNRSEMDAYICHRLSMAGYTLGSLFTIKANELLYRKSGGVPRVINILSHKALMVSFGRNENKVSLKAMRLAIQDTDLTLGPKRYWNVLFWAGSGSMLMSIFIMSLYKLCN